MFRHRSDMNPAASRHPSVRRPQKRVVRLVLALGMIMSTPAVSPLMAAPREALEQGRLGLFPATDFRATDGRCTDCAAPPQALWYFQDELIAVPLRNVAGFDPALPAQDDVRAWAQAGHWQPDGQYPSLVWLAAPTLVPAATLSGDGATITFDDGTQRAFTLAPRLPSNESWFNGDSTAWLQPQTLALRGTLSGATFTARTIWPGSFDIDLASLAVAPLQADETLATLVRADDGGARVPAGARLLWERTPGAARAAAGKPVLALMLNGAQGDDDEAHGGHFAVATGYMGARGQWSDWLVNNFYNLDAWGEKGIIASTLTMDAYLTDLNSGQAWYRPSAMLVAVLREPRAALLYQQGVGRVFNHFYRHDFSYRHATANCAGISLDTLRSLGWDVPLVGPTSKLKAWAGLPWMAITEASISSGMQAFDYMSAERSNLFPFVAFNVAGSDLLGRLTRGKTAEQGLEQLLGEDVEALIYVHVPQIPSSRAFGQAPVASYDEYMSRVPADRAQWKVLPAPPRAFPDALRDVRAPKEELPKSRRAVVVYGVLIAAFALYLMLRLVRRLTQ
jgi:hypothetical protein